MTPRREVEVIDLSDSADEIREQLRATRRSRLPVQDGEADAIIGVVVVKELIDFSPMAARMICAGWSARRLS